MKTTIKVQETTTKEVEVSLPQFRKVEQFGQKEYYAFYSENKYENLYFRTYDGKLLTFMSFVDVYEITKGKPISQSEFKTALIEARYDLVSLTDKLDMPNITTEDRGEYYLDQQNKL